MDRVHESLELLAELGTGARGCIEALEGAWMTLNGGTEDYEGGDPLRDKLGAAVELFLSIALLAEKRLSRAAFTPEEMAELGRRLDAAEMLQ